MGLPPNQVFSYSILIAVAGLCGCIVAVLTTDTIGRRTLCYIGAALATMFTALIASVGSKPGANESSTDSNVVVASVILLNGACKLGVSSQCWLIGSEIGGTQMRKKLMGWGVVIDVLAAFLVTFFTPYLQAGPQVQLGAKVAYIFMAMAALSFFFFIFFTPELKGRSLEEVDELFEVSRVPTWILVEREEAMANKHLAKPLGMAIQQRRDAWYRRTHRGHGSRFPATIGHQGQQGNRRSQD